MYIFGPVISRRLGASLGVDLVKHKTCSLDCIYCESGKTTDLRIKRGSFFPAQDIIDELDAVLVKKPELDFITFSGSGEPTLSMDIGKVTAYIKQNYPEYKIALLTNGTLLFDETLRRELLPLDLIIPSIDAVSDEVFQQINKPHGELRLPAVLNGLFEFRKEFKGMFWVEIFIVPGLNDTPEELKKIRELCINLNPDRVQLNTLDRPCGTKWVKPASLDSLLKIKQILSPLVVDIVSMRETKEHKITVDLSDIDIAGQITNLLARRPSTLDDISFTLGLKVAQINKTLRLLEESGIVAYKQEERGIFYYNVKQAGINK